MKRQWTTDELIDEWTLQPEQRTLLRTRTRTQRLGFAVLLLYFVHEGHFPRRKQDAPRVVVAFVAKQLALPYETFAAYPWSGRTIEAHRAQIRAALGFREPTRVDAQEISAWLRHHALPRERNEDRLLDSARKAYRQRGIEPPTPDRLLRLIRSTVHAFERDFFASITERLPPSAQLQLDALIATLDEGDPQGNLQGNPRRAQGRVHDDPVVDLVEATQATSEGGSWDEHVEELLSAIEPEGAYGEALSQSSPPSGPPSGLGSSAERVNTERVDDATLLTLHDLRTDPGPVGLDSLLFEIKKLLRLRQIGLPMDLFADLTPQVLRLYRNRAAGESPSTLRAHPKPVRLTLLAALCWARTQEVTDNLVSLLIALIHRMSVRAERRVQQAYIDEIRHVAGKAGILFRVAEAAVAQPEGIVREVIYPAAGGKRTLEDLVKEYKASGPRYRAQVQLVMKRSYTTYYRRMLPPLLDALDFRSNNETHQPILRALSLMREYIRSSLPLYPADEPIPLEGVVRPAWRDLVLEHDADGLLRAQRLPYELCALQALREALRSKEMWVQGARRYGNPEQDLPSDFEEERTHYYAALRLPTHGEAFVASLRTTLAEALRGLETGLSRNRVKGVKVLSTRNGWIQVSSFEPVSEPPNLTRLKQDVARRWPMTGLLDILKETALRTEFTSAFTSVATREALDRATLQKRLLLCIYALGTNTGLKAMANVDPGSTYSDLRYVRRRYISKEQVRLVIAEVANATFRARQRQVWGEGRSACASDSKKFGAWDQNLMTEWSIRHVGRGVMVYWHVEEKSVCVYSQLKSISSSEVASMIEGVLRHCTDLEIERQYVDSHGQSEIGFASCHLLGFRLMPRLKRMGAQRLYCAEPGDLQDFPTLRPVMSRPIDWNLIVQQYDQMVKYATALRLGTAEAEAILRRFTRANVQHPTYRALAELGKAIKTIFLCQYLQSEGLRREIHEALNIIESWNGVNTFTLYGRSGEIATNRLDEQEVSILCLHLMQNCLVYINTLMLQQVLLERAWLRRLTPEDRRGLTPLFHVHVNPYGRYSLDLEDRLPGLPLTQAG